MENLSNDLLSLLQYLLPGFVTAWIFYSLTSYPKPSQFERVIQALIFTLFVQVSVKLIKYLLELIGTHWSLGEWNHSLELALSVLIAIVFGFVFSYFANNDKVHKYFRNKGITKETSFPSEWFGAFLKDVTFVVLHLKDERRLYGWPIEWPSEPTKGHFVIADPSWVSDEGKELPIIGVKNILINVNDVKWVEFLEKTWEKDYGEESV
jgi:hypothetical protein